MAKSLMKKRAALKQEALSKHECLSFGVVFRNTQDGGSATVQCGDWKLAKTDGWGYDLESTVIAEFLSPVISGLPYGTGMMDLKQKLAERGWTLNYTYIGWRENGYKITRSV